MEKFKLCAFADEADKMISGQIAALQGNSMNLIELRGIDGKNVADITADEAKELKKRLDGEGITVWSIGSPIGKIKLSGDELFLLKSNKNPSLMIECGFLSNPEEEAKLGTTEYQQQVAFTIYCGVLEYIDATTEKPSEFETIEL